MPNLKTISLGLLILLLGFAFWYVYNLGEKSGTHTERTKWQDQLKQEAERKAKAETVIVEEKVVWRDRIQTVREVIVDCQLPDIHIGVLRESGIFREQVRSAVNH